MLLLWPETLPDPKLDSTTPGLINHDFLSKINTNLRKLKEIEQTNSNQSSESTSDYHTNKSIENLRNKQHYLESSTPFAFLEVEFPSFGGEVLFEDRIHKINGSSFTSQEIRTKSGEVFPRNDLQDFFMPSTEFNRFLKARDFDHDFQRDELILDKYYQAIVNEADDAALIPSQQEKQKLEFIMKKPNFLKLSVREKNLVWRMRYFLRDNPEALVKLLKSVSWYSDDCAREALGLLDEWAEIGRDDAIYLLSRDFSANRVYPSLM